MNKIIKITDIESGKELEIWSTTYPYYCEECFYENKKCSRNNIFAVNKPCKGKSFIFKEITKKQDNEIK